jgi:plasmid maintenance system antidote protein VapI
MDEKNFLKIIRGALAIQELPQWRVAQELGISESYLSKLVLGRRPMPADIRLKLIEFLGLGKAVASLSARAE